MKLSHYTDASPWAFDPMRRYRVDNPWHKPVGLWLSVDGENDWPAWCVSACWGFDRIAQRHLFLLMDVSRVLHIANVHEIDFFHTRYAEILPGMERYRSEYVNWHRVSAEFDGVIIAPYIWERRLDGPAHRWYYGWDCASGCIWNLRSVRFLGSQPFAPAKRGGVRMSALFSDLPRQVSAERQLACIDRELAKRAHVYPRLVAEDKMSQAKADEEIAVMEAVRETGDSMRVWGGGHVNDLMTMHPDEMNADDLIDKLGLKVSP